MDRVEETLDGPDGIRIELDSAEIFPHDPGAGTPAVVILEDEDGKEATATFWCALGEGEVSSREAGYIKLTDEQWNWLSEQEDVVGAFLHDNDPEKETL